MNKWTAIICPICRISYPKERESILMLLGRRICSACYQNITMIRDTTLKDNKGHFKRIYEVEA